MKPTIAKATAVFTGVTSKSRYCPRLVNGLMDLRTAVAYGPAGSYQFQLSVYCSSLPVGAGSRPPKKGYANGGPLDIFLDVAIWRESVDQSITEMEQINKLEFACNIFATRMGLDYKLRLPHDPKKTPKTYYKRKD